MSALAGRRIALIGGGGFIGHHLALALKGEGADVHVVDSLQVNNLIYLYSQDSAAESRKVYQRMVFERLDELDRAAIPLHTQDARYYHELSRVLERIAPDTIIQLAAVAHASRSNKDPYTTFDHSLHTLENALDYARGSGVRHFIYFSSSMVYGTFESGAVDEDSPCNPLGIYGALKYAGEKLVIAYHQVFGLPYTIVRPSALYGERCVSRRVIQIFIENALRGRPLEMSGDGSDSLDFTYIQDLVQGLSLCLTVEEAKGGIFNLTYGRARALNEVAELLRHEFPGLEVRSVPKDKLMPDRGTLNIARARRVLGYAPRFPIETGVTRYLDWYRTFWKG